MPPISIHDVEQAIENARKYLRGQQLPNGAWPGGTIAGPDATAEAVICQRFLGILSDGDAAKALKYLLTEQFPDGSFPSFKGAEQGSIDETSMSYAALLSAGLPQTAPTAEKAYHWIQSHGGFGAATPYTQIMLAVAGVIDPLSLPDMPIESVLLPGVEYVIGARFTPVLTIFSLALPVISNALKARVDPPSLPKRLLLDAAYCKIIEYFAARQNPSGNCFGAINVTIVMLLCYKLAEMPESDERFQRGAGDLAQWRIETADTLRYSLFNSTIWNSALILGIFRLGNVPSTDPALLSAMHFIVSQQGMVELPRDWQNPGLLSPRTGGFAFEDNNPMGSDCDSTSVALWGLGHIEPREAGVQHAINKALAWLFGMQNRSGGWASFSHGQPDKPPGPFSIAATPVPSDPFGILKLLAEAPPTMSEPALEDITGRVLQALGRLGYGPGDHRISEAISFLRSQIYVNGAWWGRWETNFLPGSSEVLSGLAAVGADLQDPMIAGAIDWIKNHQNADGGFGETIDSYDNLALAGTGESSSYVTGIVTNALIQCDQIDSDTVAKAIQWCLDNQNEDGSWPEGSYQFTVQWPWPFYRLMLSSTIYPLRALTAYWRVRTG